MVYRTGFMKMLFGAAVTAAALATASVGAGAQPQLLGYGQLLGQGAFQTAGNELVDGWRNDGPANPTIEPDPMDDGNIVVECVAFTGSLGTGSLGTGSLGTGSLGARALALNVSPVSVPRHGLGPSKCPPFEFRHIQ